MASSFQQEQLPSDTELIQLNNALSSLMMNEEDIDMEVTNSTPSQIDVVLRKPGNHRAHHLSIILEAPEEEARPDSSHLTRPGSFHGPPNPLGSHPPSPPPSPSTDCSEEMRSVEQWIEKFPSPPPIPPKSALRSPPHTSNGKYSLFPAPQPCPPAGYKQTRFKFTAEQLFQQSRPHPRLRESEILGEAIDEADDCRSKSVKFCLTQAQLAPLDAEKKKLVESEVVGVDMDEDMSMSKTDVLKAVVKQILGRRSAGGVVKAKRI